MGNLLVEKRREMGSKLEDVASVIGVSTSTLCHWEHGDVQTVSINSMANVRNLALLYNVEPQEIVQAIENNYILAHAGHDIGHYRANASSIEVSGDDDNSSDSGDIIETAQEAADNIENTDETVVEDKILCSDALAKILDACYDWTQKRQDYDDTRDIILNCMPPHETLEHLTIANTVNSIVDWFASKIYSNCTYEQFTKLVDNIKMCLTKKADWDGDKEE